MPPFINPRFLSSYKSIKSLTFISLPCHSEKLVFDLMGSKDPYCVQQVQIMDTGSGPA